MASVHCTAHDLRPDQRDRLCALGFGLPVCFGEPAASIMDVEDGRLSAGGPGRESIRKKPASRRGHLVMKKPALQANTSHVPKKGKHRASIRGKKKATTAHESDVPYVRGVSSHGQDRGDRVHFKRAIPELLAASDEDIVRLLIDDQILPD